jgi:hypothetical protein
MTNPINYSLGDLPDPTANLMSGLKMGAGITDMRQQQQAKQQALEQQKMMQQDFANLARNPTAEGIMQASLKYPSMSENLKRSNEMLSEAERASGIKDASQVYAALNTGNNDVAMQFLKEKAVAYENSGQTQKAKALNDLATMVEMNPNLAKATAGAYIAASDPKTFTDNFVKLEAEQRAAEKAPVELAEAKSKSEKAAVDAKFAESNAVQDLAKKGWDITKIQEDIKIQKQNSGIAAINAQIARESNALKRDELSLKMEEMKRKRDETIREKESEGAGALATFENTQSLLKDILSDKDTLRAAVGTSAWRGALPGTKARMMAGKIEQLQNSLAATNLDKIKGAMSDKDILFLKNMETNLDRYQDENEFIKELVRISSVVDTAKERVAKRYGVPVNKESEAVTVGGKTYARPAGFTDEQWSSYKQSQGVQ